MVATRCDAQRMKRIRFAGGRRSSLELDWTELDWMPLLVHLLSSAPPSASITAAGQEVFTLPASHSLPKQEAMMTRSKGARNAGASKKFPFHTRTPASLPRGPGSANGSCSSSPPCVFCVFGCEVFTHTHTHTHNTRQNQPSQSRQSSSLPLFLSTFPCPSTSKQAAV